MRLSCLNLFSGLNAVDCDTVDCYTVDCMLYSACRFTDLQSPGATVLSLFWGREFHPLLFCTIRWSHTSHLACINMSAQDLDFQDCILICCFYCYILIVMHANLRQIQLCNLLSTQKFCSNYR